MKATTLLLAVTGLVSPALAAEKAMPEPFPSERYAAMKARSPFGLATAVAAPVIQDKSFADGWYLSGASQLDGKNYVTVRSRDQSVSFVLFGDERNDNGVKLQNIEWSPIFGKTSATLEKDGQFAKIELLNQTEMGGAGPGMPPPGVVRPMPGNALVRPGFPQPPNAIPRPSAQPITPAAPAYQITPGLAPKPGAPAANPALTGTAAPTDGGRRRIRVIPSQPGQ